MRVVQYGPNDPSTYIKEIYPQRLDFMKQNTLSCKILTVPMGVQGQGMCNHSKWIDVFWCLGLFSR